MNTKSVEHGVGCTRRDFLSAAVVAVPLLALNGRGFDVAAFERARVLKAARQYLSERPVTVTASSSPRSSGGMFVLMDEAAEAIASQRPDGRAGVWGSGTGGRLLLE